MPVDMPDDMLKDAIVTAKKALDDCGNFEVAITTLIITITLLLTF